LQGRASVVPGPLWSLAGAPYPHGMGYLSRPPRGDEKRSPEELERLAQRLDAILSTLAAGVLELDLGGRFTYANPEAQRALGATQEELIGRTAEELGYERYDESGARIDPTSAPVHRAGRDGHAVVRAVIRYVRRPTVDCWLESQSVALRSPSGELTGVVVSFIDVTDRFRLAATERRGVERLKEVLQSMPTGVVVVDAAGRIEYANAAAAGVSGLKPEDVVGQLVADPAWQLTDEAGKVLPYDALPVPTALRERREIRGVELGVPTPTGAVRWMRVWVFPLLETDGSLRGAVVTTEDTTERRALAEQLLQAQKIEGIGQLAGGIAHDFNNLLTIILGNAEILLASGAAGSPLESHVGEIREAANRGAALTRQLLTFARKQVVQPRAVSLDRLTGALETLLKRTLGEGIVLRRSSDADLWPVKVDPGQMEQVLVNMAINARDAMPRGGSLVIETRNRTIDANESRDRLGIPPGDYVTLSIGDTGTGMSREVLAHIFDPFFTTKGVGSGSGLGLSICHGVIKQARGFIEVDTEPGRGTTFRVHLPRTADAITVPTAALATPAARGMGTILLVEDEEGVRSFVAGALKGLGFEVLTASSGKQALDVYERMTNPLDLLLTDVIMPEMGGLELARTLHARAASLPVLYMTGHFDVPDAAVGELSVEENLLLKPFTPMQLVGRVQRVLSGRP
jgi:two-component system cell cycle sensor histidine kinase/response regulator CckA